MRPLDVDPNDHDLLQLINYFQAPLNKVSRLQMTKKSTRLALIHMFMQEVGPKYNFSIFGGKLDESTRAWSKERPSLREMMTLL